MLLALAALQLCKSRMPMRPPHPKCTQLFGMMWACMQAVHADVIPAGMHNSNSPDNNNSVAKHRFGSGILPICWPPETRHIFGTRVELYLPVIILHMHACTPESTFDKANSHV
jgi:hypothetical protein